MQRRQLLEIHEQPWCPEAVRDGATDCLRLIAIIGRQFRGAVPPLQRTLAMTGATHVVDLCSGGGGPWLALYDRLHSAAGDPLHITLTDLYPNVPALEAARQLAPSQIDFYPQRVDAANVPAKLEGVRTLFTAFHHFQPSVAQAILQDAVSAGQGIAIFEQTRRSVAAQLFMVILAPIALLAVPLIRPFSWRRLFWTYLVPAIPAVLLWDGIVSCWRTYTEAELRQMTATLAGPPYVWEIGRARSMLSPLGISYLIGYPAARQPDVLEAATGPRVARTA